MYVCLCNGVTDRDIHQAVADGVETMRELRMATGCSGNCGRCAPVARDVLQHAMEQQHATPFDLPVVEEGGFAGMARA